MSLLSLVSFCNAFCFVRRLSSDYLGSMEKEDLPHLKALLTGIRLLNVYRRCAVMQELAVSGSPSALLLFAISRPQAHTIASLHGTRSAINRHCAFDMLCLML